MKKTIDWNKVKKEYTSTNISIRALCDKYDMNQSTLTKRMAKEGWKKKKSEVEAERRRETEIIKVYADSTNAELCARMGSMMIEKTMQAIETIDPLNTQGMKHLSGVMRDLKEVKLWVEDLDKREQEARIKKLEREAEGEADTGITINLIGADEFTV